MKRKRLSLFVSFLTATVINIYGTTPKTSTSFYTQKPDDPASVYFTPGNFSITADGKTDVSVQLQNAINQLKTDKNYS